MPARRPHLRPVPDRVRHEPRPEVARNVDRVARLPPETRAQAEDQEEQAEREPFVGFGDAVVAAGAG